MKDQYPYAIGPRTEADQIRHDVHMDSIYAARAVGIVRDMQLEKGGGVLPEHVAIAHSPGARIGALAVGGVNPDARITGVFLRHEVANNPRDAGWALPMGFIAFGEDFTADKLKTTIEVSHEGGVRHVGIYDRTTRSLGSGDDLGTLSDDGVSTAMGIYPGHDGYFELHDDELTALAGAVELPEPDWDEE